MAEDRREREKKNRNMAVSFLVLGALLFVVLGVMYYMKNIMPKQMIEQGKRYLEVQEYDKALNSFNNAANALPYDNEPIYYKALTLSKMQPSYKTQKELFDIAQLEDCEEASMLAENALQQMRNSLEYQIGPNYVDNVLFEDQLIRWNPAEPITFSISAAREIPQEYYQGIDRAFQSWQQATNGQIRFKQVFSIRDAKINIVFKDDVTLNNAALDKATAAIVEPVVDESTLKRMDMSVRYTDEEGNYYSFEQFSALVQHEVGHALGLWGHSVDTLDVMHHNGDFINEYTYFKPISTRDINTLMLVYKMIPDIIDVPLTPEEYESMFYHGAITYYPGENFEQEIQRLISQLRGDRQNLIIWVDLAINYAYKKQYQRSNYILNKVLPMTATDFRNQYVILYNLAVNFYKMRDYYSAERCLNLATNIQDDKETQMLEAFIDFRLGRIAYAEQKLLELRKTYPDDIEIALKLAELYYHEKNSKAEKDAIRILLENNPKASKDRRVKKYQSVIKKVRTK